MNFQSAIDDYRFLKNKGYPGKAALKIVGDRYRLSGMARNCLFRAVIADEDCRKRRQKLTSAPVLKGESLGVDWYNVLITVESYLKGLPVFLSDDGVLRDSAGIHGSYRRGRITTLAIEKILEGIEQLGLCEVDMFLDSPISFSGKMAEELRECLKDLLAIPFTVTVILSADYPLKSFIGAVATSDSIIMDKEEVKKIFDLAKFVLERSFQFIALRLDQLHPAGI